MMKCYPEENLKVIVVRDDGLAETGNKFDIDIKVFKYITLDYRVCKWKGFLNLFNEKGNCMAFRIIKLKIKKDDEIIYTIDNSVDMNDSNVSLRDLMNPKIYLMSEL